MVSLADKKSKHYLHSTLRERIVEHVFVGDVLRELWSRDIFDVEVLRPEFDAGGYDLVMNRGNIERHIQFTTSLVDGKAADIKASLKLMTKPGGCVIWILVTPELVLHSYRWLGDAPGQRLPDILSMKVAKHTKGNAGGEKGKRPGHRIIPVSQFDPPCSLNKILERLFGALA